MLSDVRTVLSEFPTAMVVFTLALLKRSNCAKAEA